MNAATTKSTTDEAEQIVRDNAAKNVQEDSPRQKTIDEVKIGHAVRKGFNVTSQVMAWAGGIFAIVATVNHVRNRRRDKDDMTSSSQAASPGAKASR